MGNAGEVNSRKKHRKGYDPDEWDIGSYQGRGEPRSTSMKRNGFWRGSASRSVARRFVAGEAAAIEAAAEIGFPVVLKAAGETNPA